QQEVEDRVLGELAVEGNRSVSIQQVEFVELQASIVRSERNLVAAVDDVQRIGELESVAVEVRGRAISAAVGECSAHRKVDEVWIVFVDLHAGVGEREKV